MAEDYIDLSDINFDDTWESTVAQKGTEAKLRIIYMTKGIDKNQNDYILPFFELVEDNHNKEFGDYMPLPSERMSPKELNKAKERIAAFAQAFEIDLSQTLDIKNDVVGKTGWAILGIGDDQDDQPTNKVNKYVIGA